jgi:hypothetical protein
MDFGQLMDAWKAVVASGIQFWIAVGSFLALLSFVIGFVTKLTPWTWDDNLGSVLGGLVAKLWKR